jgi:hypothetical protein
MHLKTIRPVLLLPNGTATEPDTTMPTTATCNASTNCERKGRTMALLCKMLLSTHVARKMLKPFANERPVATERKTCAVIP